LLRMGFTDELGAGRVGVGRDIAGVRRRRRKTRRRNDFGLDTKYSCRPWYIFRIILYLDLLSTSAMFSTSDMFTLDFLLMTFPRSSSTVLSSSLRQHTRQKQTRSIKGKSGNQKRFIPNTYLIERRIIDLL